MYENVPTTKKMENLQPDKLQDQGNATEYNDLLGLLSTADVEKAKNLFSNKKEEVAEALDEYDTEKHNVMNRPSKDVAGESIESAKLPIPYQKKIVESAVAFLYGKPLKVVQKSEGTDKAFKLLGELTKEMRLPARRRQTARHLFSETECAVLFVPYRDPDAPQGMDGLKVRNKVRCKILARSLGDILYTKFDSYGTLVAFGREYQVKQGGRDIDHFDVYTRDYIFYCQRVDGKWEVTPVANLIKKIPVVYYSQKHTEWHEVKHLINRLEFLISRRADVNDYTADPILKIIGKYIQLPDKNTTGKVVQLENGADAEYMVPQMAVEMIKDEREALKELIHYCTDTPDFSLEKMKALGQGTSGKALQMLFFSAVLKAMNKQELFEEMLDREYSIIKAIMGNVIDVTEANQRECEALELEYIFGNPLPDDFAEILGLLSTATGGAKIMSQETAVGHNPLIENADEELAKIKGEAEEAFNNELRLNEGYNLDTVPKGGKDDEEE